MAVQWTLWSTPKGIKNKVISWAALIETSIAVLAVVTFSDLLDIPVFLFPGALTGMLLLLRTDQSTTEGIALFKEYEDSYLENWRQFAQITPRRWQEPAIWVVSCGVLITAALVSYVGATLLGPGLAHLLGINLKGVVAFIYGVVVGAFAGQVGLVAGSLVFDKLHKRNYSRAEIRYLIPPLCIVGSFPIYLTHQSSIASGALLGLLIPPILAVVLGYAAQTVTGVAISGLGPSILPKSLIARIISTYHNFSLGVLEISSNYQGLVWCTCPKHDPEIVPGYNEVTDVGVRYFTYPKFKQERDDSPRFSADWFVLYLVILLWFIPAYFYRLGLKSTFYIFWPLAHMGRDLIKSNDPDGMICDFGESKFAQLKAIFWSVYVMVFVALCFRNSNDAFVVNSNWLRPVSLFFVSKWESIWLVQSAALLSGGLSLIVFIWIDTVASRFRSGERRMDIGRVDRANRHFRTIERVTYFKNGILSIVLIFSIVDMLLIVPHIRCGLGPEFRAFFTWLYQDKMPPFNVCG